MDMTNQDFAVHHTSTRKCDVYAMLISRTYEFKQYNTHVINEILA